MNPADAKHVTAFADYATFFVEAPEGSKVEDVFDPSFWSAIAACKSTRLKQAGALIRVRAKDGTFDLSLVVDSLKPFKVQRWPIDPLAASSGLGPSMPKTRAEALDVLGLHFSATDAVIKKVAEGLRTSWHPDTATDEADRQRREYRIARLNLAADILLKSKAA